MVSRVKWIVFACCGCLVLLLLLAAASGEQRVSEPMGLLSEAAFSALCETQTEVPRRDYGGTLQISGQPAPRDEASGTYYLPQSLSEDFTGSACRWSDARYRAYAVLPDGFCKSEWIASGKPLTLLVSDGARYHLEKLVLTGMPIAAIRTEKTVSYVFDKGLPAGTFTLFVPEEGSADGVSAFAAYATYRERGHISRSLAKVSYRVTLFDRSGQRLKAPLLSMGACDEWILNAMYSEPHRMRDKLSLDLWNRIANTNPSVDPPGSAAEYAELVLDGAYMGLFLLTQPTGENTLTLGDGDVLYKTTRWTVPTPEELLQYEDTLGDEQTGVFIKWPRVYTDPSLWTPMARYLSAFYTDGGMQKPEDGLALLEAENAVDYALFYQAVAARDNFYSNTYYLFTGGYAGTRAIRKIPWDLNYSFGNVATSQNTERFRLRYENAADIQFPPDMAAMLALDDGTLQARLFARYAELRKTVLSPETLLSEAEALSGALIQSGALMRESARWPEGRVEESAGALYDYIKAHMAATDAYFGYAPRG